ncbi:hypothetical protein P171DRAFT_408718 [Karstenula rhodostoma CBS 690.94]|uniref:Glycan binding protein Y3-like domain-containing protein n=1 Tax=Karstenula rhodostoma CBS 690.94 TaxID=1392251 RepID=A0A9P4PQ12_9PLEO|nr:hypothetical protein P171DRAFT_408718 [Karstenula rhodostoma CBS 690.94]
MQLSSLIAILAPIIATAQAGCYSGGDTWAPDQVQANTVLDGVCNSLSGKFSGKQTKYECKDATASVRKLEFWVTNVNGGERTVSHGDCVQRLGNEVNGCEHGGDTTTGDFDFRADPNSGRC